MKFRSNKIKPLPAPQNLEASQPMATKAKLNPVFLDLMGNVIEKKADKSNNMKMSD